MSPGPALLLGVLLLLANAFFVGAEFAVISARRSQIEPLVAEGRRGAKTALWAMEHATLMLAACQLGITVCSTGLGVIAEPALAHLIEEPLHALGVSDAWIHPIAFTVALAVVVYLHVVLGEMVPKNMAVAGPERAVLWFGPPLVLVARAVAPIIRALNWVANHAVRWTGVEPKDEVASTFTAEEVQSIVEHSQAEGVLRDEQGLLSGAIEFSERTAGQVMVPVEDLVVVVEGCTPAEIERMVARTGYSRFPVAEASGDLVGYLHVKDVLYADGDARDVPVPSWRVRALATTSPDAEVEDALRAMQRSGAHLARVDVPGPSGAQGVVFLEDILEELVGEVRDAMQRRR
ncbi:CBS domain containing-hemolysin-like protein [Sediminihabitans luteus]|uniref:CBS domain containing-hemolysin-like protein n=1 Tax=Sediminihabitans luteus TaxID=1138585 RepID=A0A2M9CDT6_9CELL|nr:hemolysin family protein [Sediminihabitans luteus]PJJ70047.1 CBS domain containing-hemolysin-like protein [Sediminihabitans luteus]GIJ00169.1 membrane protein [Sediminihabitans luteus]